MKKHIADQFEIITLHASYTNTPGVWRKFWKIDKIICNASALSTVGTFNKYSYNSR